MYTFAVVPVFLTLALPSAAQSPLLRVEVPSPGPAVLVVDRDDHGLRDLLVGDPGYITGISPRLGQVLEVSGETGAVLRSWNGQQVGDGFGSALTSLPDLDGDGVPDFAAGAPWPTSTAGQRPYVDLVSGAGGSLIRRLEGEPGNGQYGNALASLGDVDGDGVGDLAIAASGFHSPSEPSAGAGYADVVSGASGTLLWRATGGATGVQLVSVARHPDMDGDEVAELAIGFSGEERVEIRSGATGAILVTIEVPAGAGFGFPTGFGTGLAAGRDLDGDDLPDLAVGAPTELYAVPTVGGPLRLGAVYVYSGASAALVRRYAARQGEKYFGESLALIPDADGDGLADLVAGNRLWRIGFSGNAPGTLHAYSIRRSAPIFSHGPGSYGVVSDGGDWDGDGFGDIVLGARLVEASAFAPNVYGAEIVSSQTSYPLGGTACAGDSSSFGCTTQTIATGVPSPSSGTPFTVQSFLWPSGSKALLVLGLGSELAPFGRRHALCVRQIVRRLKASATSTWTGCNTTLSTTLAPELLAGFPAGTILHAQFYAPRVLGPSTQSGLLSIQIWP